MSMFRSKLGGLDQDRTCAVLQSADGNAYIPNGCGKTHFHNIAWLLCSFAYFCLASTMQRSILI